MSEVKNKIQFRNGKEVEKFLDIHFRGKGFEIRETTYHEERVLHLGDREFSKDGKSFFVEYKSGIQTFHTGNVFLETVSVDTNGKPGWVYTSKANFVLYACLLNGKILVFLPEQLRDNLDSLKQQFKEKSTSQKQNNGYNSRGLIVPLFYAEKNLAKKVILL